MSKTRFEKIDDDAEFEQRRHVGEYELTDLEIQQLKEHNQKRVKKVVGLVAIVMTLLSLALVAFSLALGRKIDMMVEKSVEQRMEHYNTVSGINITDSR
ncbi:unnamed protein product [Caenorhabditis bovis]|uniref:Uncharacterized protein n=1 Tax=Caenorhabditis bovis TaxID=2654633 RepID=A0A8S1EKW0_9PELO|nr:unnamed protein product [Caenorhabditis bovis]